MNSKDEQLRKNIEKRLKPLIIQQLHDELKPSIEQRLKEEIKNQCYDEVKKSVENNLSNQISEEIIDDIREAKLKQFENDEELIKNIKRSFIIQYRRIAYYEERDDIKNELELKLREEYRKRKDDEVKAIKERDEHEIRREITLELEKAYDLKFDRTISLKIKEIQKDANTQLKQLIEKEKIKIHEHYKNIVIHQLKAELKLNVLDSLKVELKDQALSEVKNQIYHEVYNDLVDLYKVQLKSQSQATAIDQTIEEDELVKTGLQYDMLYEEIYVDLFENLLNEINHHFRGVNIGDKYSVMDSDDLSVICSIIEDKLNIDPNSSNVSPKTRQADGTYTAARKHVCYKTKKIIEIGDTYKVINGRRFRIECDNN